MRAQLRAEFLKQRSTGTTLGLFAALLGLVLLAVLLHGFGLAAENFTDAHAQLMVFSRGEFLAALFAGLLGALSVTSEIRHGTIRPTFLFTPVRGRVVVAKVAASSLIGAGFGLVASALAVGVGAAALRARGIGLVLNGGDFAQLIVGGAVAAALWAGIGVGVGALVRHQVPTLIGITAWLLFVEGLLAGDAGALGDVGRFLPGSAAAAISRQDPGKLLAPAGGALLLAIYTIAAAAAGWLATTRRDVI